MRPRSPDDEYMADPQSRSIDAIQRALAELAYPSVAARLCARARCNESVPLDLVCEVIPRLAHMGVLLLLFRLAEGDRIEAVIRLLETDAFPSDPIGMQAAGIFAIAAHQLGATPAQRQRLAAPLRAYAAACLEQPPSTIRAQLLAGFRLVAQQIDDPVLAKMMAPDPAEPQVAVNDAFTSVMLLPLLTREEMLALPARMDPQDREALEPIARQIEAATTFAPNLPRNQLCWCGSGKKFKRCHGSDTIPVAPPRSPRALSVTDVQTCSLSDLATMRLDQLGDHPLASVIDRLVKYRAWDVAERALAAFDKREHLPQETRDRIRHILVSQAIRGHRWDLATKHAQKLRSARYAPIKADLAVALPIIERGPQALDHLLTFAESAVREPQGAQGPLGIIMQTMPAIGVLLLRADIATDLDGAADVLRAIRQMRVRLGLLPGDAAETTYAQWQAAKAKAGEVDAQSREIAGAKADADALRSTIADTVRQNRDLARRVEDLERQLREPPTAPAPVEAPADPAELRALRAKLDQLQEVVREKNLELAELRRESRSGRAEDPEPTSSGAIDLPIVDEGDDDWTESDGGTERRIRMPTWRPALLADVPSMPLHVTREAIRTVARLAIGDSAAWKAVKRAKGTAAPLHMARIGIRHLLLFVLDGASMDVIELVSRESLHVALKRYM